VKVEIFSDVVCPWCAIGKRRFESALRRFEHGAEIDVVWRAFELDPEAPARREGDQVGRLAKKYGMTRQQATEATDRLTAVAGAEGLDFHFERAQPGNTFDAHRLLHHARSAGPDIQDALKERLFVASFTEGAPIGDRETLVRLATEVGLDPVECADILAGDRYGDEVRADERDAFELGVTGVPFFVVDGKFGIPGAQSPDTMLDVLERAWTRAHPLEVTVPSVTPNASGPNDSGKNDRGPNDRGVCEGDSCAV
jgi:predicted DsbA family dithiol-disulfide isomerase